MSRFKLPGNLKVKKIILTVLVFISIVVIIQFAIENRKTDMIETKEEDKIEEQLVDNNADVEIKQENTSEEDNLYNDAYNTFFNGDYDGAIAKANIVISKYPESFKGYNIRGIAKAFSGSFENGMKDIDKALEINSEFGYARYNKALNYELYGHYDEALKWYNKALEIEDYMWSYYGIASIYGRRGDVNNTVLYLKKAVEVEKSDNGKSAIKEDAKTEKDFNPVRGNVEFENFIHS